MSAVVELRPSGIRQEANEEHHQGGTKPYKAMDSLSDMEQGYREFKERQKEERRQWIGDTVEALVQSTISRIDEEESHDTANQIVAEEAESINNARVGESEEVVADVMLEHKQRILEEIDSADDVWQLQADVWAGGWHICRIRDGRQRKHDWRDCTGHAEDRAAVRKAQEEMAMGKGLLSKVGQMEVCGLGGDGEGGVWVREDLKGIVGGVGSMCVEGANPNVVVGSAGRG
jgi:hypothetical protein